MDITASQYISSLHDTQSPLTLALGAQETPYLFIHDEDDGPLRQKGLGTYATP